MDKPDFRNTPSTTGLVEEEIMDALENDGNASMPEQVNRPNPWSKMMMIDDDDDDDFATSRNFQHLTYFYRLCLILCALETSFAAGT